MHHLCEILSVNLDTKRSKLSHIAGPALKNADVLRQAGCQHLCKALLEGVLCGVWSSAALPPSRLTMFLGAEKKLFLQPS